MNYEDGELKWETIAATAGNVATNLSPGAGRKWKIIAGAITLDTDGNAANRFIQFEVTNSAGTTYYIIGYQSTAIVADKVGVVVINPIFTLP